MAFTSGFSNSSGIFAESLARMLSGIVPGGGCVLAEIDNAMAATAGPGLAVTLNSGLATALGYWGRYDTGNNVQALNTADPTNGRYDLVVFKVDLTVPATPAISVVKKVGTPAGSPVVPTPTQSSTVWEVPLVQVLIPAGATLSSQLVLTDRRPLWPFLPSTATSTSATGGSATALPAQPVEYLTVRKEDGTLRKIAVYS